MKHLELHILQSIPVSCLNRDDLNSPKTAIFGGVQRARVSSQCWKRAIRERAKELYPQGFQGERTRLILEPLRQALQKAGMTAEEATPGAKAIAEAMNKVDSETRVKTMFFTTQSELEIMAAEYVKLKDGKKAVKSAGKTLLKDAADLSLFGRMVADAPELKIEGAAMFSHALSTHKADNEIDFFTAVDDLQRDAEAGAGMMGTLEFNAATYYRFTALNLDMLADDAHLAGLSAEERRQVVTTFIRSTLEAVPAARQNSMNGNTRPGYVLCIYRESGHPLQLVNAFEKPVRAQNGKSLFEISVEELNKEQQQLETTWGIRNEAVFRIPEIPLEKMLVEVGHYVV